MEIKNKYRQDLQEAQEQLSSMLQEFEDLQTKIAKQKRRIAALAELCEGSDTTGAPVQIDMGGLTDACRTVLRAYYKEWLSIGAIQQALIKFGFPILEYKAPMASLTTTVNRLVEAGEVEPIRVSGGSREFKWAGPAYGAAGLKHAFKKV